MRSTYLFSAGDLRADRAPSAALYPAASPRLYTLDWHHNGAIVRALEKRKPTYDLSSIKAESTTVDGLRMTVSARNGAFRLGFTLGDVVVLIQGMTREHFYKSMTSFADHTTWQDVYHVPHDQAVLYVKFTMDAEGHLVISLKEK